ncbi:MAG TPA: glycosyltransferase [Acidimicrobiales bacterium]|nr:glycosyltransferase [Acidimicrobiales bacterium]
MPEEFAPPVVAVVVTSNPGVWFEPCLESLRAQDYPNLAVLVVDDASTTDITARVAAVEPGAIVRRRSRQGGYSAAADEVLEGVEGASFYLFCHDDAVLDHDVARLLVEESFRSNAAVVGPKYVRAEAPELLEQVGLSMHRLGTPAPRIQPGELDQSQHDESREVFAVPGGCALVRADLFEALGGYDTAISLLGEEVDFCWRAQIAGARVVVAPRARVRHWQTGARGERGGDIALLQRRHELRAVLKNYGGWRRLAVLVELVVLSLAEMVVSVLTGDRARARRVGRAWKWNLSERASLSAERRRLREIRQVPDRLLVRRMVGRSRVRRFLRPHAPGEELSAAELERLESWWKRIQRGEVPTAQLTLAVGLVVVGVAGIRDLLFGRLPVVGQLIALPKATTMLGQFFGGIQVGHGVQPAPAAYGIVGLVGLVLANSTALAVKLIELGSLAVGAFGVSRLGKPFLSTRGRLVAAVAYVGLPLAWNALATADVGAAVCLGALPFVFGRIARATGLAPFATLPARESTAPRRLVAEAAPFGLLLAFLAALVPAGLLASGAVLVAVAVACVLNGEGRAALRVTGVTLAAAAVAFVCCLPWSLTWLEHGARWSAFSGVVPSVAPDPASLLRGHLGPVGAWWGTWGLVLAAGYALVVGRGQRLVWASAWWLSAVAAVALAWAGAEGWLGSGGGLSAVLASPAAVALAAACGLGVAAFEHDVIARVSLGWRQAAGGLAAACLVVGIVPALGTAIGGHADLPGSGVDQTLDWTVPSGAGHFRVLWLGDPRALPAAGWQLGPGVSWYTATAGLPRGEQDWPPATPGRLSAVASALVQAERGRTADVGLPLARLGVRYIVVLSADAPQLPGSQVPPVVTGPPARLLSALQSQSDLVERPSEAGAFVFVNADWHRYDGAGTNAALGTGAGGGSPLWREIGVAVGLAALAAAVLEGVRRRRRWGRSPVAAGGPPDDDLGPPAPDDWPAAPEVAGDERPERLASASPVPAR